MWKRLIIIFIAFFLLGMTMLLCFNYAKENFREKLYKDYEKVTMEQIKNLEDTLKTNADEPNTYYYLSLAYWHIDKVDTAEKYAKEGLNKFPQSASLKLLLGKYYVGLEEVEEAKEIYKELKASNNQKEAEELQVAIESQSNIPPRGRKNILFAD